MHIRFKPAVLVALAMGAVAGACETNVLVGMQDPTGASILKPNVPGSTEPSEFADFVGKWRGGLAHTYAVTVVVAPDGKVNMSGPNSLTGQGVIKDGRLVVQGRSSELDLGLTQGKLAGHARFGVMYGELNLSKWY